MSDNVGILEVGFWFWFVKSIAKSPCECPDCSLNALPLGELHLRTRRSKRYVASFANDVEKFNYMLL